MKQTITNDTIAHTGDTASHVPPMLAPDGVTFVMPDRDCAARNFMRLWFGRVGRYAGMPIGHRRPYRVGDAARGLGL